MNVRREIKKKKEDRMFEATFGARCVCRRCPHRSPPPFLPVLLKIAEKDTEVRAVVSYFGLREPAIGRYACRITKPHNNTFKS